MSRPNSDVDLFCNRFSNPNGGECKGKLTDVGPPPNSGAHSTTTRLRCCKCSRVITLSRHDVSTALQMERQRRYQRSTRD